MPENLTVWVNGLPVQMEPESTVSAALLKAGVPCRRSVTGEPRTALCGMGICFERAWWSNRIDETR
jgi:D-hydroxyproline dehydrogenase subunit gamma